ncbi:hypothetical protein FRC11_009219 [Ceratobasidium sp. 423]|nr:hypothetical protein FRC11_009219 [Ceratobasidium sp. 423]
MSVAGLPAILNPNDESGNKTTNTMYIGQSMSRYDYGAINDFNYHATLYQYDTQPFRTATSGGVPFTSGLNAISKHDWVDFSRIKWDQCGNASESDCLTPKVGTTRFNFDSRQIDTDLGIYPDAGSNRRGCKVLKRPAGSRGLNANSAGNAVIVYGDANSHYTRHVPFSSFALYRF